MQNTIFPIEIKPSTVQGTGVFATRMLQKGEIIEECPVLLLENYHPELTNYVFQWGESENGDRRFAVPLGYGCLYNHSAKPNATWKCDKENKKMSFVALCSIAKGEEIFVYYSEYWFAGRGMRSFEADEIKTIFARKKIIRTLRRTGAVVFVFIALKLGLAHLAL